MKAFHRSLFALVLPLVLGGCGHKGSGSGDTSTAGAAGGKGIDAAGNDPAVVALAKKALTCKWGDYGFPSECADKKAWDESGLLKGGKGDATLVAMLEDSNEQVRWLAASAQQSARYSVLRGSGWRDLPFPILEDRHAIGSNQGRALGATTGASVRPSLLDGGALLGEKLCLTYCVSTTFGARSNEVVQAMAGASAEWEQAAHVKFVHVAAADASCTSWNTSVVFDVNPAQPNVPYLARAFFPSYPRSQQNVLIADPAFNAPPYSLTGILRHELGHVLGFRHEHTRPEAGVCFEDNSWRSLTPYDSASVMHYPQCNGTNAGDLVLTDIDKQGAAALYNAAPGTALNQEICTTVKRGNFGNVQDAMLDSSGPNWAAGAYSGFSTGLHADGSISRGLLHFDLSFIPAGATITGAVLGVHADWASSHGNVKLHRVTTPWNEASVTWANFGAAGGFAPAALAAFDPYGTGRFVFSDVKSLVENWTNGTYQNDGVLFEEDIDAAEPVGSHSFRSSESSNALKALLPQVCCLTGT